MVQFDRGGDMDEMMPQMVPSAGFTPPCDYSTFALNFDLSLLPGGDQPVSPTLYLDAPQKTKQNPTKVYHIVFPPSPEPEPKSEHEPFPDFRELIGERSLSPFSNNIYLDVPNNNQQPSSPASRLSPSSQELLSPNDNFYNYRQSDNLYPSSPEYSLYTPSPSSVYSHSAEEFVGNQLIKKELNSNSTSPLPNFSPFNIKEENYLSPCEFSSPSSPLSPNYSSVSSPDRLCINNPGDKTDASELQDNTLEKQIKQESTVDFSNILNEFQEPVTFQQLIEEDLKKEAAQSVCEKQPKDHQLLRQVLRDTSFQKRYNIKPLDIGFIGQNIKMEEPDNCEQNELISSCEEQIPRENIEPVLDLAIEQMKKDVDNTCAALGISPDPAKWDSANVVSWLKFTSRQFNLPEPSPEQWSDITGSQIITLTEEDFSQRSPQCGMILYAQLEIWKATYSEENMQWMPDFSHCEASGADMSDDEEEETPSHTDVIRPTTSRSGSHIHLWQFLKELLASPQVHGTCIRWLDRSKGIFKIEDSVKVARLWGKRKNRPAMNYDKLSRSIRQYYKKGIMKKTERSQRLVYQFCHPYNL